MRLAFHPHRQESVRFLPEPCRNRNAGKVHGTVKKVKTDAIYPASVPRLLNVLLRELPGEVRENVEESFQKRPRMIRIVRMKELRGARPSRSWISLRSEVNVGRFHPK